MLGDRRRINRLLKPDRRRSADRRSTVGFNGRTGIDPGSAGRKPEEERRLKDRRFSDRVRSE